VYIVGNMETNLLVTHFNKSIGLGQFCHECRLGRIGKITSKVTDNASRREGPEGLEGRNFKIQTKTTRRWARRDLDKNSFESKDEVSAVSII
jgi:hypothetical protein